MKHSMYPEAVARLHGAGMHPQVCGTVRFFKKGSGVILEAELCGLPKTQTGFFGFHIHEGENCRGEGFPDTGGHFNPGMTDHPNHAGDLPPLLADHGRAYMKVFTDRIRLE